MPKAPRPKYIPTLDPTATKHQAAIGGFSPHFFTMLGGDFRYESNPTVAAYSSGYHESAVTTDTAKFLKRATDNKDGTHTLPFNAPAGSFWEHYEGNVVYSANLLWIKACADGFRTDTAQTILSARGGRAAGHSGSGVDTVGQSEAHDLLRQKVIEILQQHPQQTPGLTERSVATVFAAMTVTSMAPGEVARGVTGGTASLKAGNVAIFRWEQARNLAKRRVHSLFSNLKPVEKQFVRSHMIDFMANIQQGAAQQSRSIGSLRATTPERDEAIVVQGEVAGGGYGNASPMIDTSMDPPLQAKWAGNYVSAPFRAPRRAVF